MSQYPDRANPDLLERIPLRARVVLDVGCGSGALAAAYLRRNPAARMLGIERDPHAAALARSRMAQVYEADLERDPVPFAADLGDAPIDCIVYGDVLEHLSQPWEVLARQAAFLAPDGVVIVCMPNVEHWSFADRLLRGTFDYDEQGLFDRTHLRWFNTDTTQAALREAGLIPVDVTPRIFDLAQATAFAAAMAPALAALGVDRDAYLARAAPLQHVWRASRQPTVAMALVSTMLAPVGGVSEVRVTQPMLALGSEPGLHTHITTLAEIPRIPDSFARILVLHRPLLAGEPGLGVLRQLLAIGYLIVCEFDDHPDYIPVLQRPDVYNFLAVHAIQTSTEPLARVLALQNPEVAVFPNALDRVPEPRVAARRADRLTLFFGGINREQDWPPLLDALNAVAERAGPRLFFRIVADRGLFDALATPHKEFVALCDYASYIALLADSDVSFMPLADTPFNRCKSDLKFIEASAHRVTTLASHVVYAGSVEDGRTGLLFHDAAELRQRLSWLVANPQAGVALAEAAHAEVVAHRMLAYQIGARVTWYHSLWARREELHRALLERVPALALPAIETAPAPPTPAELVAVESAGGQILLFG